MKPYARILMEDGSPILRVVTEYRDMTLDVPLTSANLFLLMKEGFSALAQLGQAGRLPSFIEEETKK